MVRRRIYELVVGVPGCTEQVGIETQPIEVAAVHLEPTPNAGSGFEQS